MHAVGEQIRSILARRLDRAVSAVRPWWAATSTAPTAPRRPTAPLFVKTRERAAAGTYRQEAAGLGWLAEAPGGPPTPRIALLHDPLPGDATHDPLNRAFLALEVDSSEATRVPPPTNDSGAPLAALHATPAEAFGAAHRERRTTAPPPRCSLRADDRRRPPARRANADLRRVSGRRQRILPLTELAVAAGAFDASDLAAMHRLAERLPALVGPPNLRPARTATSGAATCSPTTPAPVYLIDPLAHGSHREVDLAGRCACSVGPSERCFAAYDEVLPLADGWQERQPLMQLGIILLQVVLFGGPSESARRLAAHYD